MIDEIQKIYDDGYYAAIDDTNPYDYKSEIKAYCSWAAGYNDSLNYK